MDAIGLINLYAVQEPLLDLTQNRPLAAVPFAGRYRLIDFTLSNMVNAGIGGIGILVQHKYRSLMDHLRSGKEWDLARKRDGLTILPPAYANQPGDRQLGDIDNFKTNLDYILRSNHKYTVLAETGMVCNIDLKAVLAAHQASRADITAVYCEQDENFGDGYRTLLTLDNNSRITDMRISSRWQAGQLATGIYILERQLLVDLIENGAARGKYDFLKHCLIKNLTSLKICGYRHYGYKAMINSVQSYFTCSMDLLKPEVWKELFFQPGLIYTKIKDEPPAKYKAGARVVNSLVANGCYIEGTVENSILFRGVKVASGVKLQNCVIMQKGQIGAGSVLNNVICDKDVQVMAGRSLSGAPNYPMIIKKGMVI
ncbi:glucose-1-phosphate adenylyltransferase subunit GlgD|nr:glucose-1-phosphate adenylyltransferase subunit GlgD [Dendrosporobacter quercicolus]NSL48124.1 glucose-1-phosphate adenylyltransferase subunit GlgD [Dendrosporobacter quercicolus DSM 1736]